VVSVGQLRDLGLSQDAIGRRVADGQLHRIHHGVFAVGHRLLSMRARYMAAVLASGTGAVASHRSGGDLWGLRRNSRYIEVTVPRGRRGAHGITAYRSRMMAPADRAEVDGIPITSVSRTLLDLAAVLGARDLGYVLDRAERLQVLDLARIEDVLDRARGRRGAGALRKAIDGWRPADTRSELEARHLDLIIDAGLPVPLLNAVVRGERYEHTVDAYWPAQRMIVQLDGFDYHRTRRDRERDATTDADLELAAYRVMRLTWDDIVVHVARTVRRLEAALRAPTQV